MKYLIGNHKMNIVDKGVFTNYLKGLKKINKKSNNAVGICISSVYFEKAKKALKGTKIKFAAQNIYYKNSGSFTGEISANMAKDFGAEMVLVGHSERRSTFNEDDKLINNKLISVLNDKLVAIFCIGESKQEREQGFTNKILKNQLVKGLKDVEKSDIKNIFFAYEPIWAIGTGVSASPKDVEKAAKFIKNTIAKMYEFDNTDNIKVLYGGSLTGKNATEILCLANVDGGLIGGASVKLDEFEKIINHDYDIECKLECKKLTNCKN